MEIRDLVARRSDLSTFLVHLTRTVNDQSARDRLLSMIENWQIDATTMFGAAKSRLEQAGEQVGSQRCVCFTETPLEYVYLLLEEIANRQVHFQPYGVAFPKKLGRACGANPVWYIDITPGHDWLMGPVNELVQAAIAAGGIDATPIGRLIPFPHH